ncbi:plancitoxin-1 [Vespa crabro]|uniref:plancitoxin-1 n=1 Tax=Vespa crabro TaxID=7445 RepID=UPI001F00C706|nr:plancitoxin-1 [Vespa crabro]
MIICKFKDKMNFLMYIIFLYISSIKCSASIKNGLGCRDNENRFVDWYVLYKIPKLSHSSNPLIRNGSAYMYITSDTVLHSDWNLSVKGIENKTSIPGNTLASLYDNGIAENILSILYNDDPPDGKVIGKYGHAKGIVAADHEQGFWMIHSVPHFPPIPNIMSSQHKNKNNNLIIDALPSNSEYSYPKSGHVRGQSFLCISLKADQLDIVGRQLIYNQIIVYGKNLPNVLSNQYPTLTDAANQIHIKNPPYKNKEIIKSSASLEFVSFAKSSKWQQDLYSDFVAPQLKSNLFVESYLNGPGKLNSNCHGLEVHNVKSVKLQAANIQFESTQDHSKWVVTMNNKKNKSWVCIGDINRANTQYKRGGGTVCLNLFYLWKNYRDSVNDIEPCPKRTISDKIKSLFG